MGTGLRAASEMMERQVRQLVRLVDDLLDVSRISRGKINLRRDVVELGSVISEATEAARESCESGGVELSVEAAVEPILLNGDAARLTQAIGNLLNNSCKFTDEGGRIELSVERESDAAVIRVRDTGIGMSPDQIPYIFDMFVQADTSLERTGSGLGIGLKLVKNLVEMHGGTVEATSAGLGKGSEFVVRLPAINDFQELPHSAEVTPASKASAPGRRILVVDDNLDSAESMSLLLEISGHDVRTVYDGVAAVETASSFLPEIVLLDIGLPKLNGYEAARKIRSEDWGKNMYLMALTGWGQDKDRERSKEAGFDCHLVKPIDPVELMKRLADVE
jgi:CheY-like chemotaxis protein